MVSHTWHLRNLTLDSALTSGAPWSGCLGDTEQGGIKEKACAVLWAWQPPGLQERVLKTGQAWNWHGHSTFSSACGMTGGSRFLAHFFPSGSISHPTCISVYLEALHWVLMEFRGAFQGSQNKASLELGRLKVVSVDGRVMICWAEQHCDVLQTLLVPWGSLAGSFTKH